jgi:anti-anti-sigma factor
MAPSATIHTQRATDGCVVVDIRGEIDVSSTDRLRQILVDTANRLRPTRIVVDLRHVTFIDSTGLSALAAGSNAARALGVGFTVRNPSPFVVTQLRQTGLYDVMMTEL